MSVVHETLKRLEAAAATTDSVLVAYSGGKDSLVTLDLCRKAFRNVVAFYCYVVPGLQMIEAQMDYARERWGVKILYYPHFLVTRFFKNGIYCDPSFRYDDLPEFKDYDVWTTIMRDTGIPLVATGMKEADGLQRKRVMERSRHRTDVLHPIGTWRKVDVLAYCAAQKIPLPKTDKRVSSGVDLSSKALTFIHDNHPEDFRRMEAWFPYIGAAIKRRDWYGIS